MYSGGRLSLFFSSLGDPEGDGDASGEASDSARYASIARAYYVALSEWGLTAEVINEWTPELLWLMFRERSKEIRRLREMQRQRADDEPEYEQPRNVLSDTDLFKKIKGIHYVPKSK